MDGIQIREVTPDRLEELMLPVMNSMGWGGPAEQPESLLASPSWTSASARGRET